MAFFVRRVLCALTIFWSAILLILIQPIVGKAILPWFGGSAGVWVTSMLFFQVLLLAGYLYAHLLNRIASVKAQVGIHLVLIVGALTFLPLGLNPAWKPAPGATPETAILGLLLVVVGLPYFVLSTTSPLLQAWYSAASNRSLPWRLYAVSNLGSLLALCAYPLALEKWFSVRDQMAWWTVGFFVFAALAAASAAVTFRREGRETEAGAEWPSLRDAATWLGLAAIPSVMWLSMAAQISQDIGAIPFLWTIPLAIYLFSFVVTFGSDRWYRASILRWMLPPMIGLCFYSMFYLNSVRIPLLIALYLVTLMTASMVCHGELARRRPSHGFVTYFYLIVSAGGALGGLFVGVIAPRLFNDYVELPASLVLTLFVVVVMLFHAPARIAAAVFAVGAIAAVVTLQQQDRSRLKLRNFYGLMRTVDTDAGDGSYRELFNGIITHGEQLLSAPRKRTPTTYYGDNTLMALHLRQLQNRGPVRIGVVGLGAGTMATYARAGDMVRFYDINPDLIRISNAEFTFLRDCLGKVEVATGDARLVLEQEPPQNFDLLILDAFSGDSVPVHLMTREAVGIYLRHLKPNGSLAFHISSRHLSLKQPVAAIGAAWGLRAYDASTPASPALRVTVAEWALLPRDKELELIIQQNAELVQPGALWTDDYSDLLSVLR